MILFSHLDCGGNGFKEINGGCYKFIKKMEFWNGAQKTCKKLGSYVLNINSKAEQKKMYSKLKKWTQGMSTIKISSCCYFVLTCIDFFRLQYTVPVLK